jgi:lipopolysaccharide transport system ATP-binding protein
MSSDDIAIRVANLSKCFQIYDAPRDRLKQFILPRLPRLGGQPPRQYFREFWALRDVSFEVRKGETVGIIGRNGAGKSTLLQLICNTLTPTSGDVRVTGRVTAMLELGSGFSPDFTGRENIFMNARILGLTQKEIEERYKDIADFADIGNFIDQPVKTYSSGMIMRLAFATQTALEPDILVVDEALAVGDAEFQTRCFTRMNKLKASGTTIMFVSHDIASIRSFCDRAIYISAGKLAGFGDVIEMADLYQRDVLKKSHASASERSEISTLSTPLQLQFEKYFSGADSNKVLNTLLMEQAGFNERSEMDRRGTGRIEILSFTLLNQTDSLVDIVDPTQVIKACFLLRSRQDICSDIHVGLTIKDKCGSQVAVIRDSKFDKPQQFGADQYVIGEMSFTLPLMAGTYYIQIGLLLFSPNTKYADNTFNFEAAEISDLVEYGIHFQVATLRKHPIPVSTLIESNLTLFRSVVDAL